MVRGLTLADVESGRLRQPVHDELQGLGRGVQAFGQLLQAEALDTALHPLPQLRPACVLHPPIDALQEPGAGRKGEPKSDERMTTARGTTAFPASG